MNQLILHPRDMNAVFASEPLLTALIELGFIADSFDFHGAPHYRPGEDFLELITFLGCSPVVALGEPGLTGEDFCHIALLPEQDTPIFLHGRNVKPPRCPDCRHPASDWQALIADWQQDWQHYGYTCPQCGRRSALPSLKWRQSAGFLRSGLAIWGIYEGEAVPSDKLLNTLQQHTALPWSYFYLADRD